MTVHLQTPNLTELKPRIAVIGVGGAGGNAVNNMIAANLEGVSFIAANTDAQALINSKADTKLQLGAAMTEGLGAGSKPEIGAAAAEESIEEIKAQLRGLHMAFITAGMGGGTGTGAAPVIAKAAREEGVLAVGVVTKPFQFEGQRRMRQAEFGIQLLAEHVDTLITIPNQNLFKVAVVKTTFSEAFAMADQVLHDGIACITDVMVKEGIINLDFADVNLVMRNMGKAMMGTGEAGGENRGREAAEAAISNPLLEDITLQGARGLLVSIIGGQNDLTLYEVDEAANRVREEIASDANIIVGTAFDESLNGKIRVSVVATGLEQGIATGQEPVRAAAVSEATAEPEQVAPKAQPVQPEYMPEQVQPQTRMPLESRVHAQNQGVVESRVEKRSPGLQHQKVIDEIYADSAVPREMPANDGARMPSLEDFSPVGQAILRDQMNPEAAGARKNKKGLFERLANLAQSGAGGESRVVQQQTVAKQQRLAKQSNPADTGNGYDMMDPHVKGAALSSQAQHQPAQSLEMEEDVEFPEFLRKSGG